MIVLAHGGTAGAVAEASFLALPVALFFLLSRWSKRRARKLGQIETGRIEKGQVETGHVEKGQVETGQVETGQVETGQVGAGEPRGKKRPGEGEAGKTGGPP